MRHYSQLEQLHMTSRKGIYWCKTTATSTLWVARSDEINGYVLIKTIAYSPYQESYQGFILSTTIQNSPAYKTMLSSPRLYWYNLFTISRIITVLRFLLGITMQTFPTYKTMVSSPRLYWYNLFTTSRIITVLRFLLGITMQTFPTYKTMFSSPRLYWYNWWHIKLITMSRTSKPDMSMVIICRKY